MTDIHRFTRDELEAYVWKMPQRLVDAVQAVKARSEPTTIGLQAHRAEMVDAVLEVWLDLMEQVPDLFGDRTARQVFDQAMAPRLEIYRRLIEPQGDGWKGTIWPQIVSTAMFEDAKSFVLIAANALMGLAANAEKLREMGAAWLAVDVTA